MFIVKSTFRNVAGMCIVSLLYSSGLFADTRLYAVNSYQANITNNRSTPICVGNKQDAIQATVQPGNDYMIEMVTIQFPKERYGKSRSAAHSRIVLSGPCSNPGNQIGWFYYGVKWHAPAREGIVTSKMRAPYYTVHYYNHGAVNFGGSVVNEKNTLVYNFYVN